MKELTSRLGEWVSVPTVMRITFWEFIAVIILSDVMLGYFLPDVVLLGRFPKALFVLIWNLCFVVLYNGLKR